MATRAKDAPQGGTETNRREPTRGNERRGGWRDTATGKYVPKAKALDTLSG